MARKKLDPLIARWRSMNRRCISPKDVNYCRYGAVGITVAGEWSTENSEGFKTFADWVKQELNKIPLEHRKAKWRVVRRNVLKEFSPANCYITSQYIEVTRRPTSEWNFKVFDERRKMNVPVSNYNHAKAVANKREHKTRRSVLPASWFAMLFPALN